MTRKQIEYVILAALLLTGFLYAVNTYYLQDKWSVVTVEQQQVKKEQDALLQKKQQAAQLKNYSDQVDQLQRKIADLDQQIPYAKDLPGLIQFFYKLTSEYNVTGDKIELTNNDSSSNSGLPFITVKITYTGTSQHILDLLKNLQHEISRKITLTETTLQSGQNGQMSLSLNASIYYQKGSRLNFEEVPKEYPIGPKGYQNLKDIFAYQTAGDSAPGGSTTAGGVPDSSIDSGDPNLQDVLAGAQTTQADQNSSASSSLKTKQTKLSASAIKVNGINYLPFREVFQAFGGTVDYLNNQQDLYAWADLGSTHVMTHRGSNVVVVNNRVAYLTNPALDVQSRRYISVNDWSVLLGHPVTYDEKTNTLTVR